MLSNLHRRPVRVACPTPRSVPPFFRPSSSFMGLTMRAKCPFFSRLVLPCPSLPALRRVLKAPSAVQSSPSFMSRFIVLQSSCSRPQTSPTFSLSFSSLSFFLRHSFYAPTYSSTLISPQEKERRSLAQGFRMKSILLCLETFDDFESVYCNFL